MGVGMFAQRGAWISSVNQRVSGAHCLPIQRIVQGGSWGRPWEAARLRRVEAFRGKSEEVVHEKPDTRGHVGLFGRACLPSLGPPTCMVN